MTQPPLSDQLETLVSPIDEKEFVPLDILESVISKENVKNELGITDNHWKNLLGLRKPSDLPDRVTKQAKRIFAALVNMNRATAIEGLLDEGLGDKHLPLSSHPEHEGQLSCDGVTIFPFGNWPRALVKDFLRHKQWFFLAPILDTRGQLIKINQDCPLPFTKSSVMGRGGAGIVHWGKVHQAHQQGIEVGVITCGINLPESKF
jgi:hypothetical protein